ncbi:MAG: hypothetical protein CM15mP68_0300 [Pseudomonadota bacterium]|nr:MAG: hypothetical protein CM15mP68_0300 [Pseudomonadota bacterium]
MDPGDDVVSTTRLVQREGKMKDTLKTFATSLPTSDSDHFSQPAVLVLVLAFLLTPTFQLKPADCVGG